MDRAGADVYGCCATANTTDDRGDEVLEAGKGGGR